MKTFRFTLMALFMALVVVLSSFGINVPGGHLYLNDVAIVLAALLFNPKEAFIVCGIGAFLGDLFLFVSLITHGLQGYVIAFLAHTDGQLVSPKKCCLAVFVGALIMIVGYTLGRAFIYATIQKSLIKLPFQILQAGIGAIFGYFLRHYAIPKEIESKL